MARTAGRAGGSALGPGFEDQARSPPARHGKAAPGASNACCRRACSAGWLPPRPPPPVLDNSARWRSLPGGRIGRTARGGHDQLAFDQRRRAVAVAGEEQHQTHGGNTDLPASCRWHHAPAAREVSLQRRRDVAVVGRSTTVCDAMRRRRRQWLILGGSRMPSLQSGFPGGSSAPADAGGSCAALYPRTRGPGVYPEARLRTGANSRKPSNKPVSTRISPR